MKMFHLTRKTRILSRRALALALILTSIISSGILPTSAAPLPDNGKNIAIESCIPGDSFVVNIGFFEKENGKAILDYWSAEKNEVFTFTSVGNGIYRISPCHAPDLALNGNKSTGGQVTLNTYDGSAGMKWKLVKSGDSWMLQNMASKLYLTVKSGTVNAGQAITVTTGKQAVNQKFNLFRAEPGRLLADGVYMFKARNSSNVLNVQFAPATGIGKLVLDPGNYQANELFILRYNEKYGAYTISPLYRATTGINCLYGAAAQKGSQAVIHPNTPGDTACLWYLSRCGKDYRFQNVASKLYLDVAHGQVNTVGCRINVWSDSFANQVFTPVFVEEDPGISIYENGTNPPVSSGTWDLPMDGARVQPQKSNDWGEYYSSRPSRPYHCGVDYTSSTNSNIVKAAADGVVEKVGFNSANGNYVIIRHTLSGKTVYSFYAHLSLINCSDDDPVAKGTQIGVMGNTGSSSMGPHLHFAIVDTLWSSGGYHGYIPSISNTKGTYQGVTYFCPHLVIANDSLPS